jgi:hypothetical protein
VNRKKLFNFNSLTHRCQPYAFLFLGFGSCVSIFSKVYNKQLKIKKKNIQLKIEKFLFFPNANTVEDNKQIFRLYINMLYAIWWKTLQVGKKNLQPCCIFFLIFAFHININIFALRLIIIRFMIYTHTHLKIF